MLKVESLIHNPIIFINNHLSVVVKYLYEIYLTNFYDHLQVISGDFSYLKLHGVFPLPFQKGKYPNFKGLKRGTLKKLALGKTNKEERGNKLFKLNLGMEKNTNWDSETYY